MLIINNSLPKTGGTRVHMILQKLLVTGAPAPEWRDPDWKLPTVPEDRLEDFIKSSDWVGSNIVFKAHYRWWVAKRLDRPGIRVVTCTRDIADQTLSLYHHHVRHGLTSDSLDLWLHATGFEFVRQTMKEQNVWAQIGHVCSYEEFMTNPAREIIKLGLFLGIRISGAEANRIADDTSADAMRPMMGDHIRTGSCGAGRAELPAYAFDFIRQLQDQE